jgi:hypothetical protein
MKQLLQYLRTGNVDLAEVPRPLVRPGHLLLASDRTLISTGTERMLVEFGKRFPGKPGAMSTGTRP